MSINNDLIDLNDSSNSSSNANIHFNMSTCKSEKKKVQRDPFAHRRVEKTRRDRMNMSLNKLASLIPESFRKQNATTRIDKIKTLDIAIAYVEHLQSLVKQQQQQQKNVEERITSARQDITETILRNSPILPTKISTSTNTTSSFDESLWYMKGVYNGSVELISYLIEYTQLGSENTNQMCENVELLLELFRQYHRIYFNTFKINDKELEFIINSLKNRKFPLNNKKLIQKIKIALANNNIQLPANFYLSICKLLQRNYSRSSSTSSSSGSGRSSVENNEMNNEINNQINGNFNKRKDSLSTNGFNNFQYQTINSINDSEPLINSNLIPKSKLNQFSNGNVQIDINYAKVLSDRNDLYSKQLADADDVNKAKKLKTNLIQRFNHMSHRADSFFNKNNQMINNRSEEIIENESGLNKRDENALISHQNYALNDFNVGRNYISFNHNNNSKQSIQLNDNDNYGNMINRYTKIDNETASPSEVFSIFILHNSQDFYISACIDESLIDSNLVKNILKNKDYKPKVLQKVKIDALFSSNILIGNRKFLRN